MQQKFAVLNQTFNVMNQIQYRYLDANKIPEEWKKDPMKALLFAEQEEARKFAEYMAKGHPQETFFLVAILDDVRVDHPVIWTGSSKA